MRLFNYLFVGGVAAAIDIGLFTIFSGLLEWPWLPVSIFTFMLATSVNYLLSIKLVFESGTRHKKNLEIIGVFIISGLALLVNQLVLYLSIEYLLLPLIVSKVLATATVFFWNYFARCRFIF
jgi:putative flippase GtrA